MTEEKRKDFTFISLTYMRFSRLRSSTRKGINIPRSMISPTSVCRSRSKRSFVVFISCLVSLTPSISLPTWIANFSKLACVSCSRTRIEVAFLSSGTVGGTTMGVSDSEVEGWVSCLRICAQSAVEAVGGRIGRPYLRGPDIVWDVEDLAWR